MHWEVEQKFRVDDLTTVEAKLAELNVRVESPVRQVDRYFNHPQRDFGKTDEALRLRQVADEIFITYKGPKIDATTKTRCEVELPLGGGAELMESFAELLEMLGFREVATVQKTRRKATLLWKKYEIEIALDQVKTVGSFVELETTATDAALDAARAALADLAQKLQIVMSERRSYLELLLNANP
jgi:adenylate cyclase class 2